MNEFTSLAHFAAYAKGRAGRVEMASREREILLKEEPVSFSGIKLWEEVYLHPDPNEEDCRFCRAMANCPAMRRKIESTIGSSFNEIVEGALPEGQLIVEMEKAERIEEGSADVYLGILMSATEMIEDWVKSVRAEVERRLLRRRPIPGWGLELGRQGPRKWKDEEEAERTLRVKYRLSVEQSYDMSVISPTTAEKLLKTKAKNGKKMLLSPKQWADMQINIDRSPAKPSVKPVGQIKEPYVPGDPTPVDVFSVVSDGFAVVEEERLD